MIAASSRESMGFMPRHQTGMQAADRTTLPHHLEIRTTVEPHDQLMLGMGVGRALYGKVKDSGTNHANWPVDTAFHSSPCPWPPQPACHPLKYKPFDSISCL